MRQQGKTQSQGADQEPVIQLTRGQMVGAVCALLVGALVFYLLGVVTSRFEPVLTGNQAQQGNAQLLPAREAPGTSTPAPRGDAPAPEGRQTSPRRDVIARKDTPSSDAPAGARTQVPAGGDSAPLSRVPAPTDSASAQPEMRTTVTNLPAPSPVDADRPAAASGPKPVTLPSTTASATPAPASSTSAPPAGQTTPAQPAQPAQPSAAAQPAAGSETAAPVSLEKIELPPENLPAAGAAPAQGAFYSIQLIAFSSANKAKADAYAKDVRENAGLDVELETSPDGKLIRLYVGRYADREGAVKACLELKKQARFSQAFVPQEARKAGS